ncbi:hypothetical protein DSO57_1039031 [Entomophthora muscae]|uniref:Uncharacterized protein n=1 Tax=Entomophthora muscae TaxID=34485 RepID=A0ACC2T9U1_9FUNG|nr:hypothetical protein DSO57_1039031 [Entomophthora muscae]
MTKLFAFKSRSTVNLGLHSGAASGNLGLVKFALDNGQAIDSVVNGLLPIHAACAGGHTLVAKYLIERGADVNARRRPRRLSGSLLTSRSSEDLGSSALHFAAANGNVELIHLLLSKGANAGVVDKYGSTPLSIALAKRNMGAATLLQQQLLSSHSTPSLISTQLLPYPKKAALSRSAPSLEAANSCPEEGSESEDDIEVCSTTLTIPNHNRRSSVPEFPAEPTPSSSPPVEKPKSFRNFFRLYHKTSSSSTISSCSSAHSLSTSPAHPSSVA